MSQLQMFFTQAEETKHKIKEILRIYKDALADSLEYKELSEKITTLRERKKQIERSIQENFISELTKLDDLRLDLSVDKTTISDAAISMLMKGETVEVVDQYNNKYEPVFKVSFKKQ